MSRLVVYTNSSGMKEFRVVPDTSSPSDYSKGVLAGPPDLSDLDLDETQIKELNNLLVEAGFATYPDLSTRRGDLVAILKKVLPGEDVRAVRNEVLALYQRAYYDQGELNHG